jgi:tetratricopeptide (TPR) repeat protein
MNAKKNRDRRRRLETSPDAASEKAQQIDRSAGDLSKATTESTSSGFLRDKKYFWWRLAVLLVLFVPLAVIGGSKIFWRSQIDSVYAMLDQRHDLNAIEKIKGLEETFGKRPEFEFLKSRAYRHLSNRVLADQHLKFADQLGFDIDAVQRERQLMAAQSGDIGKLQANFSQAITQDKSIDDVFYSMTMGLLVLQQFPEAADMASLWMSQEPDSPGPDTFFGMLAQYQNEWETADKTLTRALRIQPDYPPALIAMAVNKTRLNQNDEAVPLFEQYLEYRPESTEAKLGLANALQGSNQADRGLEMLRELAGGKDATFESRVDLAQAELESGNARETIDLLQPISEIWPEDIDLNYALGRAYSQLGEDASAEKYLARSEIGRKVVADIDLLIRRANLEPNNAQLKYQIGHALLLHRSRSEGRTWLISAIVVDSQLGEAHRDLAEYYSKVGDTGSAEYHQTRARAILGE